MFLKKFKSASLAFVLSGALSLMGCASSSTTETVEVSSLTSLPDLSEMVNNQSSNPSINADVVGTPIPFSEITSDDIGEYFFGDVLDDDLAEYDTPEEQQDFQSDFFEGMNKCQMISTAARAFSTLAESGTTLCYMKNVPVDGELEIVEGSIDDIAHVFDKQDESTVTKVTPSNMPDEEEEPTQQDILIKVLGGNDTTENYEIYLLQCNDGVAQSMEHITVDSDGLLSYENTRNYESESYNSLSSVSVSAPLVEDENGNLSIAPDAVKSLIVKDNFSGTWGEHLFEDTMNLSMAIDSSQIEIMSQYKNIQEDDSYFINKIYSITNYAGSSFGDVAFSASAMSQSMANYDADGNITWRPQGTAYVSGAEFNEGETPKYASETSSDLYTEAENAADNFESTMTSLIDEALDFDYSTLEEPVNDVEGQATTQGMSCDMEVDVAVTLDFSAEANMAIGLSCEGELNRDGSYICDQAWSKMREMSSEFESGEDD